MRARQFAVATTLVLAVAAVLGAQHASRRAVVLDDKQQALIAVDIESGELRERVPVPSGRIFQPRDPSRLVVFSGDLGGPAVASILEVNPLRLLSTVTLGKFCNSGMPSIDESVYGRQLLRFGVIQNGDGRRLTVLCSGSLVSLDLTSGRASTLALPPAQALIHVLPGDNAALTVSTDTSSDVLFVDLATLRITGSTHMEGNFELRDAVLSPDGTAMVIRKDADHSVKAPPPSELLYFDISSGALRRTVTLPGVYRTSELSGDGAYLYASNVADERLAKGSTRVAEIVSLSDGSVAQRIPLGKNARWLQTMLSGSPRLLRDSPGTPQARLLVLDGGHANVVPLPGAETMEFVDDPPRNRVLVAAGRTLHEFALPRFERVGEMPLGTQLRFSDSEVSRFVPSDDRSRILWIRGNRVRVLNTEARTVTAEATVGTTGHKARKLLGEMAVAGLGSLLNEPMGAQTVMQAAAFRKDSREAYVLASTGELATVDVNTGRVTAHRDGGSRLLSTDSVILAIDSATVHVLDRSTGSVVESLKLEGTGGSPAVISFSTGGDRLLVGGGTSLYVLDATSGRLMATARGFGRITAARWMAEWQ